MSLLVVLVVVTLMGVGAGFLALPALSIVIGPAFPMESLSRIQIICAQVAAKVGLLIPTRDGEYAWRAGDDTGDIIKFDHNGETYELERRDRLERVGWRPFGLVSIPYPEWTSSIEADDLELAKSLAERLNPNEETDQNQLVGDGGVVVDDLPEGVDPKHVSESGRVPLAETRQGNLIHAPVEYLKDDDRVIWDLEEYTRETGTLGDSSGIQKCERKAIQDAGPQGFSNWMLIGAVVLMIMMGAATGLLAAGVI